MSTTKTPEQIAQNFIKKANIVLKHKRNEIKKLEEIRKKYIEEAEREKAAVQVRFDGLCDLANDVDKMNIMKQKNPEYYSYLCGLGIITRYEEKTDKINRNIKNFNTETDSKILQIQREISEIEFEIARMEYLNLANKIQK